MSEAQLNRFWRVMTYPIHIFPGRRSPRIPIPKLIEQSELPPETVRVIQDVIRRTRLWRSEKSDVAIELIAHFKDGTDAGRTSAQLIEDFGDIKTAARLMRRAKKRNRPLWWRAQRRLLQAFVVLLLVYVGAALLLATRHPNPTVDYVAELNRPILASAEGDRAWPIYRDAWTKEKLWSLNDDALYWKDEDGQEGRYLRPDDTDWPSAVAFLTQHRPLLDAIRSGGLKPTLGYPLKFELTEQDNAAFCGPSDPTHDHRSAYTSHQPVLRSLTSVLLPMLGPMHESANLLAADMWLAASQNDGDRLLNDYRALMGLARQCREAPFLVSEMVDIAIISLADCTLMNINQYAPAALTARRVDLLHMMASADPLFKLDLTGEHDIFLDMIQRVYSDDGHGNGTPTLDGLRGMGELSLSNTLKATSPSMTALQSLTLPAAAVVMASRSEIAEKSHQFYTIMQDDTARPLWVKLHSPGKAIAMIYSWKATWKNNLHYALLAILAPSIDHASISFDQVRAVHEATMVALSLEAYRDDTGRYPATLGELNPHYLPAVPLDYSTGGPLRYKLVDGKPLLYGLGKNNVDDGGVWTEKKPLAECSRDRRLGAVSAATVETE